MLKVLIKNNLRLFFNAYKIDKKAKGKSILLVFGLLCLVITYGGLYYTSFSSQALPFYLVDKGWIYFSYAQVSSAVMILFMGFALAISYLFESKDDEILLSMPIKKEHIIISRYSGLFIYLYALSFVCLIPTLIAWQQYVGFNIMTVICFVLSLVVYPLMCIGISSVVAYFINKLSKKTGSKNAIKTIFTIIIVIIYEVAVGNMDSGLMYLLKDPNPVINVVKYIYPISWFGKGIANGNILMTLGYVVINVAVFYLCFRFVAKRYFGVLSASYNYKQRKYVEKHQKSKSPIFALLSKELSVMTKTFVWIFNWIVGVVMVLAGMIAALVYQDEITLLLSDPLMNAATEYIALIVVVIVCFLLSTAIIGACSLSMEGKHLWILKVSPLSTQDILLTKVMAQLVVTLPVSILASLETVLLLKPTLITCINVFVIMVGYTIANGFYCVYINCKHPFLDWINEQQPIKQSSSTLIAIIVPIVYFGILAAVYYFILGSFMSVTTFGTIVSIITALTMVLSFYLLMTKGKKAFERIN